MYAPCLLFCWYTLGHLNTDLGEPDCALESPMLAIDIFYCVLLAPVCVFLLYHPAVGSGHRVEPKDGDSDDDPSGKKKAKEVVLDKNPNTPRKWFIFSMIVVNKWIALFVSISCVMVSFMYDDADHAAAASDSVLLVSGVISFAFVVITINSVVDLCLAGAFVFYASHGTTGFVSLNSVWMFATFLGALPFFLLILWIVLMFEAKKMVVAYFVESTTRVFSILAVVFSFGFITTSLIAGGVVKASFRTGEDMFYLSFTSSGLLIMLSVGLFVFIAGWIARMWFASVQARRSAARAIAIGHARDKVNSMLS